MPPAPTARIGELELSAADPAVIVALTGPDDSSLEQQVQAAVAAGADLVEWRADLWDRYGAADPAAIARRAAALRELARPLPLLLTVRTRPEGGGAEADVDLAAVIRAVAAAGGCDAVDVEIAREQAEAAIAAARTAELPVVASSHELGGPLGEDEVCGRLARMEESGAQIAKIAVTPRSLADEAALLLATARRAEVARIPLLTIAMGEIGLASRLIGHRYGSCATFALSSAAAEPSAPGQVPVDRVREARAVLAPEDGR